MKNANDLTRLALAATFGLRELDRRETQRSFMRSRGFDLAKHDQDTRELREISVQDCLAASKEARDAGDHQTAVEWAEKMARQEWLASERTA
jgi:hypothetical protein